MSRNSSASSGGMGILGVLAVIFIVLKLTHLINWSWWWVLAPIWLPIGVLIVVFGVCVFAYSIYKIIKS